MFNNRAAAGEQTDAGQVHQGDREGEAGPPGPGEEAHQRDQEGGQAGTDGMCEIMLKHLFSCLIQSDTIFFGNVS